MFRRICFLFFYTAFSVSMAKSMRLEEIWSLIGDFETANIATYQNLKGLLNRSEGELATLETGQDHEKIRLKRKDVCVFAAQIEGRQKNGITSDTAKITDVILAYQNTRNPEEAFVSLLKLRQAVIIARSLEVLLYPISFPRAPVSSYSDINDLLCPWDNRDFILLEEEARQVQDYVHHALISAFWDKVQLKPISDHTKTLVMESPSLWPLLEKKKGPHETYLEDGALIGLIRRMYLKIRENEDDFLMSIAEEIKDYPDMKTDFPGGPPGIREQDKRGHAILAIYHIFKQELSWIKGSRGQLFGGNANLFSEMSRRFFRQEKGFLRKHIEKSDFVYSLKLKGVDGRPIEKVCPDFLSSSQDEEDRKNSFLVGLNIPTGKATEQKKFLKRKGKKGTKKRPEKQKMSAAAAAASAETEAVALEEELEAYAAGASRVPEDVRSIASGGVESEFLSAEVTTTESAEVSLAQERVSVPDKEKQSFEYVYPKAVRTYNKHLIKAGLPVREGLSKDQQNYVDDLFGRVAPNNIIFQEFSKFWIGLGGAIETSGGSHRHLVAPDKTPLWGTFIPHGRDYAAPEVEALRAAAYWIGCRPSV